MANVLSVENAVLAEEIAVQAEEIAVQAEEIAVQAGENAILTEEIAVQAEEIARLRGLLEIHTSHGNQPINHEKILEPMDDVVDQFPHGALCSSFPCCKANCFWLALILTAVEDHFVSCYLTFFSAHFKISINGGMFSLLKRRNRKIWTRKEGTVSQIRWYIANLSSGTKSISQTPCTQVERSFTFWTALTQFIAL